MLKIDIKSKDILDACKDAQEEVKKFLSRAVKGLAIAAKQHINEMAKDQLSNNVYKVFQRNKDGDDNITLNTIDENTHVITMSGSAMWVEEGIPTNTPMATDRWLFKSDKTKVSKDGNKYLVIPFKHSKFPSEQSGYEKTLSDRVQFELKAQNKVRKANGLDPVPWKKIETDKNGKPKEGFLHEFNFKGGKAVSNWHSDPLERIRVYQAIEKDNAGNPIKSKSGKTKVTRSWMTFRTASSKYADSKFIHPGYTAKKYMDKTAEWAENEFYNKILPEIFAKWKD